MSPAVYAAFTMGLLGATHCAVMCGGIASTIAGSGVTRGSSRVAHALAYNVGRVGSYAAMGALAGGWASCGEALLPGETPRIVLRGGAALVMLGTGLHLAGMWPAFARIEKLGLPIWRRVAPIARRLSSQRTMPGALALGLAWGFLPCGLVYAALALALASGSAAEGARTMAAFGVGTLPLLLGVTTFARAVGARLARSWIRRTAGVMLSTIAAWTLYALATASGPTCCTSHAPVWTRVLR